MYKYFAFISYSSKDIKWGKRLHLKLTQFRLPSILCSDKKCNSKPISPVFFAPYYIQPGELSDELKQHLRASKYLIVISSPNSSKSEWVGMEIEYFCSVNDKKNVFFFIIDGEPNSSVRERECYNPILKKMGFVDPLGVNINERIYAFPFTRWNRERAYIQLITKLLEIDFDTLWNHHKRYLIQKILYWLTALLFFCVVVFLTIRHYCPVDVSFILSEQTPKNESLPKISDIELDISAGTYNNKIFVKDVDCPIIINEISRSLIKKDVRVSLRGEHCIDIDTFFLLNTSNTINIYRDIEYYGHIRFLLFDMDTSEPIPDTTITIDGFETRSDSVGLIECFIPIEKQRNEYAIQSESIIFVDSIIKPPFFSENRVVLAKKINK